MLHLSPLAASLLVLVSSDPWRPIEGDAPPARLVAALAHDAQRGQTLLFGGVDAGGALEDQWLLDGDGWIAADLAEVAGPAPRWEAGVAYDSRRGRLVVFGGKERSEEDPLLLRDTWEWDGATWTQVSTKGPTPRYFSAMAFDEERGLVLLHGGRDGRDRALDDTWTWDGERWRLVDWGGTAPRFAHALAWDPVGRGVLMFGGADEERMADTWRWNGKGWDRLRPTGPVPPARAIFALSTGPPEVGVVLAGGRGPEGALLDDLWRWDGERWSQLGATLPGPRLGHALAWDRAGERLVLFGGKGPDGPLAEGWFLPVAEIASER